MKEVIKKEILYDLTKAIEILQNHISRRLEDLKQLSEHTIEDVALYKDLDTISITVLLYSLYKIASQLSPEDTKNLIKHLTSAKQNLNSNQFGKYNRSIKNLFTIVRRANAKVKEHLDDVMHAARIKKGTSLLQKGLSIGQAAGLMGLSNWDLQAYAAKTNVFEGPHEATTAKKRLLIALKIFTP